MKLLLISLLLIIFLKLPAQVPSHAKDILNEATAEAAQSGKNVFIIFHASWCGWCHKMDTAMNDKAVKSFFNSNYVIRHLTVYESRGKEKLENPGALDLLKKYHGNDQGIPFWVILNKNNTLLADSFLFDPVDTNHVRAANTGCPAAAEEVEHFIKVLKKTSSLNDSELSIIRDRFSRNKE